MDYINWLHDALVASASNLGYTELVFKMWEERDFEKTRGKLKSDASTINVIVHWLPASISYDVISRPIQITAWSEGNSINECFDVLRDFATENNYYYQVEKVKNKINTFKHIYSSPAVLDGFQNQGVYTRAEFVISATLVEIDNVADVSCTLNGETLSGQILIDGVAYKLLTFSLAYTAGSNTVMAQNSELASSTQSNASIALTIGIPCTANAFVNKVTSQMAGDISGNTKYSVSFSVGEQVFSLPTMIVSTVSYNTSPEDVPAIAVGLSL